jgi:tetratricopeptide (TPR) repeat protein
MKYSFSATLYLIVLTHATEAGYTQSAPGLQAADSLYMSRNWAAAKTKYAKYLGDTSENNMVWNRLGFCNQNLGLYEDALRDYNKALSKNPPAPVKSSALFRMSMVNSILNKPKEAGDWLMKSTASGYNSLHDLDSLDEFKNLRSSPDFNEIRKKVYEIIYPCSREPRNRDFDFWIGDWNCYRTGTQILSGYSHVESIAGGCAILENYTSTQAYTGKSFNFYDTITAKWEQDWIGSGGSGDRQHYYQGEFKDGAMHFSYETTNPGGQKVKGTFIFYFIDKDTVRQYQDVTDENGKTLSVTYDLTYQRKR